MKKITMLIAAVIAIAVLGYSQNTDYKMWETIYLKPKKDKLEELKKGMAEHNKKYHNDGSYKAHIWKIHTGKHEGEWLWAMGPCTWTDLENRPESEEHDKDWMENVEAHTECISDLKYWKLKEEYSYSPQEAPLGKVLWTAFELKPFEKYRFEEMLKKVAEVYEQKQYSHSMLVYASEFDNGDGQDMVIGWGFKEWSWFDRDKTFVKDYEEIHGPDTWMKFMEEFREVVKGSTDELAEFMPELSGGN